MSRNLKAVGRWSFLLLVLAAVGAAFQASTNPVVYYAYEEAAGPSAADSSGNNLTGTHTGGVLVSAVGDCAPVPAGNQRSLIFNIAANAYVNTPNSASMTFTGPFTAAAWIKPTANYAANGNPNSMGAVIQKWDWVVLDPMTGAGTINGYGFHRLEDGRILMFNGTNLTYTTPTTVGTAPLNVWTHVAIVFDGAFNRIYLNGVQDTSVASTAAPGASSAPLHIGNDDWIRYFYGNIDEVKLFGAALTAAEVLQLYSGMLPPTGLTATATALSIGLTWNASANANNYTVQRATAAGGPWTTLGTVATTTYTDSTAVFPVTYWYQVIANGSVASSAPAGPVSAMLLPPAPKTTTSGSTNNLAHRCGCDTIADPAGALAFGGAALLALALAFMRRR